MLTAAASSPVGTAAEVVGLILGVLGLVALLAFAVAYFWARRGQATTSLQADTIAALEAANNEKAERIDRLEATVTHMEEQVAVLRELVTQAGKVDVLRGEQAAGFAAVMDKLNSIDRKMSKAS